MQSKKSLMYEKIMNELKEQCKDKSEELKTKIIESINKQFEVTPDEIFDNLPEQEIINILGKISDTHFAEDIMKIECVTKTEVKYTKLNLMADHNLLSKIDINEFKNWMKIQNDTYHEPILDNLKRQENIKFIYKLYKKNKDKMKKHFRTINYN